MEAPKKMTLVMGASPNPHRYSYRAVMQLQNAGHPVLPIGLRKGSIGEVDIKLEHLNYTGIDTITMYMGEQRQKPHYEYLLSLNPKRIIFNPGAENPELEQLARKKGIEVLNACTLVMLSIGNF